MMKRKLSDSVWILTAGLAVLLALAIAVQSFAATADEMYDRARAALNAEKYREAEEYYRQVYETHRDSELGAESVYWRAFALYRLGGAYDLEKAVELLELYRHEHGEQARAEEAFRLQERIRRALAERGRSGGGRRVIVIGDAEADAETETRMAALQALMMMDSEKALPVLRKIIDDRRPGNAALREQALMVLGTVDEDAAREILLDVVAQDEDPELVSTAIFWLAQSGGEEALDAIEKAYRRHADAEVREAALFAIGQHGGARAVALLAGIARDEDADPDSRRQALFALMHGGAEESADVCMDVFRSSRDPELRETALFALAQRGGDVSRDFFVSIVDDGDEDMEVRCQALQAAAVMGLLDVPFLEKVYDSDADPELREQVFVALTRTDDPAALDLMIDMVRNEKDPELRRSAVFWLGQFDDDRVADLLLEIINGED